MKEFSKFDYYRYWLAEKLHKLVNVVLFTRRAGYGYGEIIDKEDQEQLRILSEKTNRTYDMVIADEKNIIRKRQRETLRYTLEQDGHYEEFEEVKDNGDIIIGIKLSMLGINAKSIKNDIKEIEKLSVKRGIYKPYKEEWL